MANNISLIKKYVDNLDEVYKNASTSSVLDGDASLVEQGKNTNEIVIPKIDMSGLGDYSRNSGYADGDVTLTYQTVQFNYDRGRKFSVDTMDNEETAGIAFGKLSSEFIRTKVGPELDAVRYATYASLDDISTTAGTLATGQSVLDALKAATNKMDEDEVPTEDRILFITPSLLTEAETVDTTKSKAILGRFSQIVKVPQSRFFTAIETLDGKTTGEEAGGFKKAEDAKDINFMIVHKPAVLQYMKHRVSKVITPEQNQGPDAWAFPYRAYGLIDAYENKRAGIYVHYTA